MTQADSVNSDFSLLKSKTLIRVNEDVNLNAYELKLQQETNPRSAFLTDKILLGGRRKEGEGRRRPKSLCNFGTPLSRSFPPIKTKPHLVNGVRFVGWFVCTSHISPANFRIVEWRKEGGKEGRKEGGTFRHSSSSSWLLHCCPVCKTDRWKV